MKAVVVQKPGAPEVLKIEDRPLPPTEGGWVRIHVKGFGLNRAEMFTRQGHSPGVSFPRILGIECVGLVDHDPSQKYEKGAQVAAIMGGMGRKFDGSYAQYVVVPLECVIPFHSQLPWSVLAALPEMFHTTHGALSESLELKQNDTLLIRGGTSSIGLLAARLAKAMGAHVVSTSRSHERIEFLKANGADDVVLDTGQILGAVRKLFPEGVTKVLELVGATTLVDSLSCTATGGIVSMVGILGGKWILDGFEPMRDIPHLVKLTIYTTDAVTPSANLFQAFLDDVAKGNFTLAPPKVFALEGIIEAHRLMEANEAKAKLVVVF